MNYFPKPAFPRVFLLFLYFILLSMPSWSLDLNTESDRKAIVSEKLRKFSKPNYPIRRRINLTGYRDSDYNSRDYNLSFGYREVGSRVINNVDFENEIKYRDLGTSVGKTVQTKRSELYDLTLSSKIRILEQDNYVALYHRTIYDDMSDYYYDLQSAVGFGRFFFDQNLEFDVSLGYRDVKTYGYNVNVIPSFRLRFDITDNFRIIQRAFLFIDHETMDNEIKTRFVYDLNKKLSMQIAHEFEQRRYEDDLKKRAVVNRVDRRVTFGIIYKF